MDCQTSWALSEVALTVVSSRESKSLLNLSLRSEIIVVCLAAWLPRFTRMQSESTSKSRLSDAPIYIF